MLEIKQSEHMRNLNILKINTLKQLQVMLIGENNVYAFAKGMY